MRRLKAKQRHVEDMLAKALPVLQTVLDNHGRLSVEWPRHTLLWKLPLWQKFEERNGLRRVYFDRCSLGVAGKCYPIRRPWCVSTSSLRVVQFLSQYNATIPASMNMPRVPPRNKQDITLPKWLGSSVRPYTPRSSANTTQQSLSRVALSPKTCLERYGCRMPKPWRPEALGPTAPGQTSLPLLSVSCAARPDKQAGPSRSLSF